MSSALDSLSPQQRAFVERLAEGMKLNDAYVSAGYRPHRGNATRLREKESICAALAEIQRSSPEIADKAERQRWLTDVLRGAIEDARLSDRLKACELLAKIGGDMVQRHQMEGAVPVTIVRPDPIDE
jgi:hypothetical protein